MSHVEHILSDAITYRGELLQPDHACVRVFAGAADGVPGLIVDRFGPLVVGTDYNPSGPGEALTAVLEAAFPGRSILLRWRGAEGDPGFRLRWAGIPAPADLIAVEDESVSKYAPIPDTTSGSSSTVEPHVAGCGASPVEDYPEPLLLRLRFRRRRAGRWRTRRGQRGSRARLS